MHICPIWWITGYMFIGWCAVYNRKKWILIWSFWFIPLFSFHDNTIWSFSHNSLSFDPIRGNFDVNGVQYEWNDGIFSITLSNRKPDGYKTGKVHSANGCDKKEINWSIVSSILPRNGKYIWILCVDTNFAESVIGFSILSRRWFQSKFCAERFFEIWIKSEI